MESSLSNSSHSFLIARHHRTRWLRSCEDGNFCCRGSKMEPRSSAPERTRALHNCRKKKNDCLEQSSQQLSEKCRQPEKDMWLRGDRIQGTGSRGQDPGPSSQSHSSTRLRSCAGFSRFLVPMKPPDCYISSLTQDMWGWKRSSKRTTKRGRLILQPSENLQLFSPLAALFILLRFTFKRSFSLERDIASKNILFLPAQSGRLKAGFGEGSALIWAFATISTDAMSRSCDSFQRLCAATVHSASCKRCRR